MEELMSDVKSLNIIELPQVRGNKVPGYDSIQQFLLPHLEVLQVFWWSVWWCVLGFVLFKFLVLPNLKSWRNARRSSEKEILEAPLSEGSIP